MTGTPSNANIWADADVYVAFDTDAELPATIDEPFGPDWDRVGLLNGEDGFTESRDEDVNDHYAWGGILIRTSRRNFKLTRKFTALESNEVTDRLRWPGSTSSQIVVPSGNRIERVKVAFETIDGPETRRLITRRWAEITVDGDVNENEQDIAEVAFMATIFPDADGVLFDTQETGDIAPLLAEFDLLLRVTDWTSGDVDNEGTIDTVASPGVDTADDIGPFPITTEMGDMQSFSSKTDEGSVGASLWSTPHDANMIPTTSVSMRAYCQSRGDATGGTTTNQAVWLRKINDGDPLTPTLDLAVTIAEGEIRASWTDENSDLQGLDVGSGLDVYDCPPVRWDLDLATGELTAYTYVGGDPVTQTGGAWVEFATDTFGPTTILDDAGALDFQVAKGIAAWGELWIDGVMVARFDANDGEPGDTTIVSSDTGETWTKGDNIGLIDATLGGVGMAANGGFIVDDNPLLDLDADQDATLFVHATAVDAGQPFAMLLSKFTGSPGSTGVGYGLGEVTGVGGLAALNMEATNFAFAGGVAMTAPAQLLVATIDRTSDISEVWRDGTSLDTSDVSAVGDMSNTGDLKVGGSANGSHPAVVYAVGVRLRKLTNTEITVGLPAALGV